MSVAIYDSEVWLMWNGELKPLTHDHKPKSWAALSPSNRSVAYVEACSGQSCFSDSLVVLNLSGERYMAIEPHAAEGSCNSILHAEWTSENSIAVECHINPSLSEYLETNLTSGRNTRELLGFGFVRSPDNQRVAHVGWIVHFAPPYAQSEYIQIDRDTVYPVREPRQDGLHAPDVVRLAGTTYKGIHGIRLPIVWSPDSQSVAFVDCTFDWTPNTPSALSEADGKASGQHCALGVGSLHHKPQTFPIEKLEEEKEPVVEWTSPRRVIVRTTKGDHTITIP